MVLFWSRELFQLSDAVFQGMEVSLHKEKFRDANQMAVRRSTVSEYYGGIGTAQPGWKRFPWSPKRNVLSHLILTFRIFC